LQQCGNYNHKVASTAQTDVHGNVLSFEDARRVVTECAEELRSTHPGKTENLSLLQTLGRTLAQEVRADRDFPPFPRATRDGYAVRRDDVAQIPVKLKIVGQIKAGGTLPSGFTELRVGEAVEIMTGAPVPRGADAVVMVEYTDLVSPDQVVIKRTVTAGENVVPQSSEGKRGDVLLARGTRLGYPEISVAAAVGASEVEVFRRPRIAILSTGDEVVPITSTPADNQIRNSNSLSLAAQIMLAGGEPVQLPIAPDEPKRLRELIAEGLKCDLLLLSGGVSMGKYDLVEQVLSDFSAEFLFTGCNIQPGKPLVFGRAKRSGKWTYFFGLPGNPISTMVTFELFARELVLALGHAMPEPLRFVQAKLRNEFKSKTGLTRFLPGLINYDDHESQVELLRWQGSGDIVTLARANCYVVVHPEREKYEAGATVTVLPRW
jgi:molybdopterin molybdotransferase